MIIVLSLLTTFKVRNIFRGRHRHYLKLAQASMHAGRGFLSLSLKPSLWMFIRLAPDQYMP